MMLKSIKVFVASVISSILLLSSVNVYASSVDSGNLPNHKPGVYALYEDCNFCHTNVPLGGTESGWSVFLNATKTYTKLPNTYLSSESDSSHTDLVGGSGQCVTGKSYNYKYLVVDSFTDVEESSYQKYTKGSNVVKNYKVTCKSPHYKVFVKDYIVTTTKKSGRLKVASKKTYKSVGKVKTTSKCKWVSIKGFKVKLKCTNITKRASYYTKGSKTVKYVDRVTIKILPIDVKYSK